MTSIAEQTDRYETFYQGNSGHAVVLLPGLCGSELEMGAIPRLLKQSNHTYTIPRIKGYSAHTGLTGYQEWIDSVDQYVTDLSQTHTSISIAGLSMGATLALAVAEQNSKVHSLVILSPVLYGKMIRWSHFQSSFLAFFYPLPPMQRALAMIHLPKNLRLPQEEVLWPFAHQRHLPSQLNQPLLFRLVLVLSQWGLSRALTFLLRLLPRINLSYCLFY